MILHINSCARNDSRTKKLADALLKKLKTNEKIEEINLYEENLKPLTEEKLLKRQELINKKNFSDEIFEYARQFSQADTIVISAPFWDLSFPSVLKVYVENIYITGLVSEYGKDGIPHGLCKAKKLYYVATAGGPFNPKYSFDYFKELAINYFGIPEVELLLAENLDIFGLNSEDILNTAIRSI